MINLMRFYYSSESGRYCLGKTELHCGDCFQLRVLGKWHDVRIEMSCDEWYLIGLPGGHSLAANYEGNKGQFIPAPGLRGLYV